MARLVLDSGAVIALAARESRVRAFIERAIRRGDLLVVPAVVVAETTRGGPRDAPVNQILKAVDEIAPVTEETGRMAGRLLGRAGLHNATVDALVVASAVLSGPAEILTGDVDDIALLAADWPEVRVYSIGS